MLWDIIKIVLTVVALDQSNFNLVFINEHDFTRTTDTQTELFFKNLKLLGLGRQIEPKFYEAFGVFLAKL